MVMAKIYIICGEYDKAMDEIETVLSQNTLPNANMLKLTPWIDPIRDNPRFKEMIKRYSI